MIRSLRHELEVLRSMPARAACGDYAIQLALSFGGAAALLYAWRGYHGGFAALNALAPWLPGDAWSLLTFSGDALFAASATLLLARRYPDLVWQLLLATLIASLLVRCGKELLPSLRPPGLLEADRFHLIGPTWRRHSFPSGHAATLLSFACVWGAYLGRPQRMLLLFVATALAATRVIVGVHWPVDVLAGAAAGAFSAWAALRLSRRWRWGLTPAGHGFGLFILGGCAVAMLFYSGGVAAARLPAALFAACALLRAARDYDLARRLAALRAGGRSAAN